MNRNDLINLVSKKTVTKEDARNIIIELFETIKKTVYNNEKVKIKDFGVFTIKETKARLARNPKTGAKVAVGPKKMIKFKQAVGK